MKLVKNVPIYIRGLGEGSEGGSPHPLLSAPERGLGEGSEGVSLTPILPDTGRRLGVRVRAGAHTPSAETSGGDWRRW